MQKSPLIARHVNDQFSWVPLGIVHEHLTLNQEYVVEYIEMHSSFTVVKLKDIEPCFGSTTFDYYLDGVKFDIYNVPNPYVEVVA